MQQKLFFKSYFEFEDVLITWHLPLKSNSTNSLWSEISLNLPELGWLHLKSGWISLLANGVLLLGI